MNNLGLASSFAFALLALAIVFPIYYGLSYAEAASGDTSDTTLNITSVNMSASLDLLVTDDNGTFASNGAPLEFNVSTNNYTGYTVSIRAKSGTDLTNTAVDGNNNTVNNAFTSISGSGITSATFDTSTYNGMWGIKPNYYNSNANTDKFYPSPTTTGVTLNQTKCANGGSNSDYTCSNAVDTYTIALGARATYAQAAGTYTNTYILSAVGNYPRYTITYDANGGTGAPAEQSSTSSANTSINFSTTIPEKDGYEFIGWCDVDNSADPTSCSGNTYSAGDSYALDLLSSNEKPLYAIWKATAKLYMQDLTMSDCKVNVGANGNSANIGDNITVYDRRDESDYTVRYINGLCWMTQNLRITGTISSTDSNFTRVSSFNVSENDLTNGSSYSTPCYGYYYATSDYGGNGFTNTCSHDSGDKTTGVWYNYKAATAGQISGTDNNTVATQDICPANWHLPTAPNTISGTEMNKLVGNTTAGWQNPTTGLTAFGAVAGGYYNNGSLSSTGYGIWWSATASTVRGRLYLHYDSSNGQFYGSVEGIRYYGYFVRCVRSETIADATYMQDVTSDMVSKMSVGDTATLKDNRDDTEYVVGKLADNKLWMLENLAFNIVKYKSIISTANTNIASSNATDILKSLKDGNRSAGNQYANGGITTDWGGSYSYSVPMIAISGNCGSTSNCTNNPSGKWNSTGTIEWGAGVSSIAANDPTTGGKVGVYYNFCAASAGSYCYGSGTSEGTSSGNATSNICPYNWSLPTGNSGEFKTLYTQYSSNNTKYVTALRLPLSGVFHTDKAYNQGIDGDWWSSTRYNNYNMYTLYVATSGVLPTGNSYRYYGYSVRCVLK